MSNSESRGANYTVPDGAIREVRVTIPASFAGLRLDQALAKLLPEESRTRLARLIEEGQVRVDGSTALPRSKVKSGEAVEVALAPRQEESAFKAEEIELEVVHEDDHVLVIDKPAGLVVHPGSGNWSGTMLNALLHHAPQLAKLARAGIVHRLDKDTSGLLVVAKTEPAQASLVRQLQARKSGKPAVTHYRVRKSFAHHTLLECELESGRTHQIRVHLASIGHPVEGDPVYAGRKPGLLARQALHAWKLAFAHPATGKPARFESPLPQDFKRLLGEVK
jgi:23S rRNA pseudouridine1911/1915/1917 synthase